MLTLKIMSFNGYYVNFGCHKVMSIKIYIQHKMTLTSKWSIFWFLPKPELFNMIESSYCDYIQGDIDRMVDKDIEAYISTILVTICDIQYSKLDIQVASGVVERRKTQDQEILAKFQICGNKHPCAQSLLQKLDFLVAFKKHVRIGIKLLFSYPVILDFSILFQKFRPKLSEQPRFQP